MPRKRYQNTLCTVIYYVMPIINLIVGGGDDSAKNATGSRLYTCTEHSTLMAYEAFKEICFDKVSLYADFFRLREVYFIRNFRTRPLLVTVFFIRTFET